MKSNQPNIGGVALDFRDLYRLFNSVAVSVALAESADMVWRKEKGSLIKKMGVDIYNLTIGCYFDNLDVVWEPPAAELQLADSLQLKKKTAQLSSDYWQDFIRRALENPKKLGIYLNNLQIKRNESKQKVARLLREANQINRGIEQEIGKRLMGAAAVKFVANSSLIIMSNYIAPGAAIAFGIGSGAVALRVQFYQGANAFDKASTIIITTGDAKATAWKASLDSVQKAKVGEIQQLLARSDTTVTQRLSTAMQIDARQLHAAKASYGASIANAIGRGLQVFAIGLEARDLYNTYQSSR